MTFDENLAALARFQPDFARCLGDLAIPDQVQFVTGRDGSRTFKIPSDNGTAFIWLGRSSMPTISARELFGQFQSDGQSVCLPGVLTGLEPLVVAEKIPVFCAVFVVEEHPLHVKLALHLYDYRRLIDSGRIVFLIAGRLQEMLVSFFQNHCGYSLPTRLLPVPQFSAVELAELQQKLEQTAKAVLGVQQQKAEASRTRLAGRCFDSLPLRPRLAIVSNDARRETVEEAMRLQRAAARLGWPVRRCVPDSPGACHVAGRLDAVEQSDCDLVLFVNCLDEQVQALLPSGLPTASWLVGPIVAGSIAQGVAADRLYLVSSQNVKNALANQGVDEGRIQLCGPGADVTDNTYSTDADPTEGRHPCEVAMMFDLPDDRAIANSVTLISHLALWQHLQEEVARRVDEYRPDHAASILERAERKSGVSLKNPSSRDRFLELIRHVIVPATRSRMAAKALVEHGFRVAVWGHNWPTNGPLAEARRGPIPIDGLRRRDIQQAKVIVLGGINPMVMSTALDLLAAGRQVVCLRGEEDLGREFPMLGSVAPFIRFYTSSRELVEIVADLTGPAHSSDNGNQAARKAVLAEHSLEKRLLAMAERLREEHVVDSQRNHH